MIVCVNMQIVKDVEDDKELIRLKENQGNSYGRREYLFSYDFEGF